MGDIQSRDCYSVDFIRWLRDISFDCLLVGVTEDGWHDGSLLDDAGETKTEKRRGKCMRSPNGAKKLS